MHKPDKVQQMMLVIIKEEKKLNKPKTLQKARTRMNENVLF